MSKPILCPDCIRMRKALRALVDAHIGASHALDSPVWVAVKAAQKVLEE